MVVFNSRFGALGIIIWKETERQANTRDRTQIAVVKKTRLLPCQYFQNKLPIFCGCGNGLNFDLLGMFFNIDSKLLKNIISM
jgi:hypothetical protein